eukprot:6212888-Pleurochrysis_carterae.AAC.1
MPHHVWWVSLPYDAVEDDACCNAALVCVGRLPVSDNLPDDSLLLLLGLLGAYGGAQPAPALPASNSRATSNAAAVDVGVAVVKVVRVLVGLEEQRLQLQHVRRA